MTETQEILFNGKWPLKLPKHRAEWPPLTSPPYWEPERLDHMYEHIKPGDVVFDVGSEEGDLPALWASWGAQVVMFEPNPKFWPCIRATWEANHPLPPLGCFVGFAGIVNRWSAHPLEGTGWVLGDWPQCAAAEIIPEPGFCNLLERPDIPAVKIDRVLFAPDALTIDTEGSELFVLQGAEHTLRSLSPKLWISSHPDFQQAMYGYEESDLLAFLDSVNYRYELLAEDHERHFFAEPK